jgi:triosephosphate isomerase
MRRKMVAGNWKMNGLLADAKVLAAAVDASVSVLSPVDVILIPPFVHIAEVANVLADSDLAFGAQDLSEHESGAHTGDVSGAMLRDAGCDYVLVGHSERRQAAGETNEIVANKFLAAQKADLLPILCLGETLSQRENGETETIVGEQLKAVVECAGLASFEHAVIAYEPVWAIGTGKTATPEQAEAVHAFIRAQIAEKDAVLAQSVRILYGGSMKPDNASELMAQPNIDGGLVGGASLKADDFLAICNAAIG